MFQCLPGLNIAVFDKVQEEEEEEEEEKAKCHPLTCFALMALARKKFVVFVRATLRTHVRLNRQKVPTICEKRFK